MERICEESRGRDGKTQVVKRQEQQGQQEEQMQHLCDLKFFYFDLYAVTYREVQS